MRDISGTIASRCIGNRELFVWQIALFGIISFSIPFTQKFSSIFNICPVMLPFMPLCAVRDAIKNKEMIARVLESTVRVQKGTFRMKKLYSIDIMLTQEEKDEADNEYSNKWEFDLDSSDIATEPCRHRLAIYCVDGTLKSIQWKLSTLSFDARATIVEDQAKTQPGDATISCSDLRFILINVSTHGKIIGSSPFSGVF